MKTSIEKCKCIEATILILTWVFDATTKPRPDKLERVILTKHENGAITFSF